MIPGINRHSGTTPEAVRLQ